MYNVCMERDLCKKCGMCCSNIPVDFVNKVVYRDGVQRLSDELAILLIPYRKQGNITICKCKYLLNKLCTHPNKPLECQQFPSSAFAFLPEDCAYEGEIFIKHEEIKRKIRIIKEEIIDLKAEFVMTDNKQKKEELTSVIYEKEQEIEKYKQYGAKDW